MGAPGSAHDSTRASRTATARIADASLPPSADRQDGPGRGHTNHQVCRRPDLDSAEIAVDRRPTRPDLDSAEIPFAAVPYHRAGSLDSAEIAFDCRNAPCPATSGRGERSPGAEDVTATGGGPAASDLCQIMLHAPTLSAISAGSAAPSPPESTCDLCRIKRPPGPILIRQKFPPPPLRRARS
jgi:hypothetical protein